MRAQCRVDGVQETAPASHAEFLFRTVIYTITRLNDGRAFRIRMPRRTGWRPGDVVTIENATLEASAI